MTTLGRHPNALTVKLTLGDGAHLVATSANGWAGPVTLHYGPRIGDPVISDVGTVDGDEVSWTLTEEHVEARAAHDFARLEDNGVTLAAGRVLVWSGGLGSTTTQTIASLTAGPPGPTAVSADPDNVATLGTDGLIYVSESVGGGGDTTVQIGTVTLPESPTVGLSVSVLADSATVLPEGITWDSGGEPTITERMLLVFVWSGDDWVGTYGPSIPDVPVAPDTTGPTAGTLGVVVDVTTADGTVTGAEDETELDAAPYSFRIDAGSWSAYQAGNTYEWTGLTPETSYDFQHRVRDAAGNITEGAVVTDTTDPVPPDTVDPTPGTLAASAITSESFTLTISGASDDQALDPAPYAFSTDNGSSFSAWQTAATFDATGLTPETEYTCVHKVRDLAGNEATGSSIAVETSAVGGWTPASLPGLAAWYDASDAATITQSGGLVSQWNDKSGNGRHLTQATDLRKPLTGTRTINGLNVLDFTHDGTNGSSMSRASVSLTQPVTVCVVTRYDNTTSTPAVVSSGSGGTYLAFSSASARFVANAGTLLVSTKLSTTDPIAFTAILNGASSLVQVDGADTATGNAGTSGIGTLYVGGRRPDLDIDYMNGAVAEIVIVSGALSTPDLTALEDYMSAKWGTP